MTVDSTHDALAEALREITRTDWDVSEGITPFQFEQRIHRVAADALRAGSAATPHEETLREALAQVAAQQPRTLAWLRDSGIVFDGPLGSNPKNWQHVAFSIYTDLCEADSIASTALAADLDGVPR